MAKKNKSGFEGFINSIGKSMRKLTSVFYGTGYRRNQLISTGIGYGIPITTDSAIINENYYENVAFFMTDPLLNGIVNLRARIVGLSDYNIKIGRLMVQEDTAIIETDIEDIFMFLERIGLNKILMRISVHLDIYGNDYIYKIRDERGEVVKLLPLQPEIVDPQVDPATGQITGYRFRKPVPSITGIGQVDIYECSNKDMMHFMTNKIGEYAVGISFLYSLYDTLKSRASFTRLLPTLITSQVYPWTVLSVDEKNAGSDLLRELNATKDNIKDAKINREVPLITMPNYFKLEQFTQTNKNMSQLLSTITEFTDKNIFAVFGLNDSILYAKGSTDLSRKQGRDLFLSSLKARQREMEIVIDELIDEYMLNKSSLNTDYDFLFSEISKEDADASLSRILSAYKSNLINEEQAKGMYKQAETLEIPSEKKKENIELSGGVDDT